MSVATSGTPAQVDVRGPRFTAWVTTALLSVTLLVSGVSGAAAALLLVVQAAVFALGAIGGPRKPSLSDSCSRSSAPPDSLPASPLSA